MTTNSEPSTAPEPSGSIPALIGERLTLSAFSQLSGTLGSYPYVKLVVDRDTSKIHFINSAHDLFHVKYIARNILGIPMLELENSLDSFNYEVYKKPDRRFLLGILSLHKLADPGANQEPRFFSLETVEADTMTAEMLQFFYNFVRDHVDQALPLLLKPANHLQEGYVERIPAAELPRILAHELFSSAPFVALNPGKTWGRLRLFHSEQEYRETTDPLQWHDIIVMHRVPDDIPRLAGIINAEHTTPLSHTNILAAGWQIPNAVQLGVFETAEPLDGQWVQYTVDGAETAIGLERIERPSEADNHPSWVASQVVLERPEVTESPIVPLSGLRWADAYRYGTKAANLGELFEVMEHGSNRLFGFYRIPRPPRKNLLGYLAKQLDVADPEDVSAMAAAAAKLFADHLSVPRGIALPFSLHQRFLESSPSIQQAIGKLKMALELGAREVDALCVQLQRLIRGAKIPQPILKEIDDAIIEHLSGTSTFVVRSSSNAEDLAGFSAAGIYESINHVSTALTIVDSIKEVWASLVSARSVRLREQAGISLDDCYMGVIIQEQVAADLGGVLVTSNPMAQSDFRNVYLNATPKVTDVMEGNTVPLQYLYNTVEGGGRTVSLGAAGVDLDGAAKDQLQKLALAGRLLQSHFAPDYTFGSPVDIEWAADAKTVYLLQLRPYAG
ncbi:PEP/pyruvate-binding domain-containing protein [Amycolatopsis sp. cg5]|uniref:PEP/pyruvate-binding domain-containing protein n=1 Tax=Amycolatopsis sp. cg5 TaxID=3238802 RepID=UPI0035232DD4